MAETAVATFGPVKFIYRFPLHVAVLGDYHLGYAFAVIDGKWLVGKIYHYHTYFSAIIGVYGAWGVDKRYAVLEGESAARPYLTLMPLRKLYPEACRYQGALEWL